MFCCAVKVTFRNLHSFMSVESDRLVVIFMPVYRSLKAALCGHFCVHIQELILKGLMIMKNICSCTALQKQTIEGEFNDKFNRFRIFQKLR